MVDFIQNTDISIIRFIDKNISNSIVDFICNVFTYAGYYAALWIVFFIIILIKKKNRHYWLLWGLTFTVTLILAEGILKNIVQRPRPFIVLTDLVINTTRTGSFSFPSGHASFSGASFYIFTKIEKNRYLWTAVLILSILIPLSRLILKVHFLTDILAGYLLGLLIGFIINIILKKFHKNEINN